ncbi:phosphotransferase [Dyella psychrodurans]|uniref:Phosphotransferase n=1 Tax=Dyella psychrodurans TaxID=1927960 RepID=A0A370X7I1_9GAMM|nr:phosphotransferase [Dyella psychrodurans]
MTVQADWMERIPHTGAMRLLDIVHDWNATSIHAKGERLQSHEHPLCDGMSLHAVHLAEYGAQAVAVHGALLAASRGDTRVRQGRLVSLRDVHLTAEYVDLSAAPLDIHAECLIADERGAQYTFRVEQRAQVLATGRVAVMHMEA